MVNFFEKQFDNLAKKIQLRWKNLILGLKSYFKKLIFPLYLFPIKLVTYTAYYLVKFLIKFIFAFISLIFETIIFPFKSLKNFLKSIFILGIFIYLLASVFVIADYLTNQYGYIGKFLCSFGVRDKMVNSVVRVVGGYSEGTGFFISPDQVITNFHVIADEPSPKIIFPDGNFVTPVKILGNKDVDLAVLFTEAKYPDLVLPLPDSIGFKEDEPLIATGYALGTDLTGKATSLRGRFIDFRKSKRMPIGYIQTDISLVKGMSGGPLVDQCGSVVGINTISLAGLSLFINADWAKTMVPDFTDQNITKIEVDPSLSPEEAVRAFYTYLKARRMEDGFNLLSEEYLKKTNFEEWTNRFTDILDVDVIKSEKFENTNDIAFVKFSTKNWVDGEAEVHFYEGTWQTVKEDGVYKMFKSKIVEVENPDWDWFYE
ncbi:MAG: Peptidase S1 and S6 chymotrypsin/Hap [Candidatus Woesebacteria bacterium GW2011_GWB1_43_14]|uniref:Peptidase S1 and S6 chymotrypsin/Hap n=1 Tax=Candidatus Woesebacteria bacterium GW2011_GWB1_43_14 TaxID=1618578 RepID=A0A0G1DHX7_9BACT|nr:MAG: Peptidase S1 and S6 chymotrypsin/Hap [Candidatus Woesebacteria bacterium GW2011_GWA1_39_11b]KKS78421.1 MAG: Peptidase S1 and S6 chymotrypsin/Hap [Candidatus Woesebacteria bacterium GW2011_GWC1_42_9]KKS97162.1 MAG: Peptidase S1 and S6 chymotrypsin/Hap [Candidatus Woesebacteria bacterium GW2011_GWB1_43_14]